MELSRNVHPENTAHKLIEAPLKLLNQCQSLLNTIAVIAAQCRRSGSRTNRLELVAVILIPVLEETDPGDIGTWFWKPV
jgi:hypothetical protein